MTVHSVAAGLSVVEQAVKQAADVTGVDFEFLMRTAKRESGYDSSAHAPSSSAAGLFQFTEQTWLKVLKRHGSAHGYARYASLIQETGDGKFSVPGGAEAKRAIMDLRYDPHASAVMAGELAGEHAAYLRGRTGREPTSGELYMAHFLGAQGSAKLIEATGDQPGLPAAQLFPEAAAANHNVFFASGRPVSVSELYHNLNRTTSGETALDRLTRPGKGDAFVTYANAAREEHQREQETLIRVIMGNPNGGATSAMFSSELLSLMAEENRRR